MLFATNKLDANVDSLRQVWTNAAQNDTLRFNAIGEYYDQKLFSQPDSVILLASYHLELAQKNNSEKERATALKNKAIAHDIKSEYDLALKEINKALDIYSILKDSINLMKSQNVLGNIHSNRIEYSKAIECYLNCLDFYGRNKNDKEQAKVFMNLGLIHFDIYNYDLALEYYYQTINLVEKSGHEKRTGLIWLNIAQVNLRKKDYHLAIENNKKALKLFVDQDQQFYIAYSYSLSAKIHQELNQLDTGLHYIEKARKLHQEIGNDYLSLDDQIILAKLIYPTDVEKATKIGTEVLKTIDNHSNLSLSLELYYLLYKCYKVKQESKLALSMLEKYNSAVDSFSVKKDQFAIITELIKDEYDTKISHSEIKNEQIHSRLKLNQLRLFFLIYFLGAISILVIIFNYRAKKIILNKEKKVLSNKISHLEEMEITRHQLIQSDKMASLGLLTAGVAHEINNPVNFISNGVQGFKKILNEYIQAPKEAAKDELVGDMNDMIIAIEEGARRTKNIVKSLRLFSIEDTNNYVEDDIIAALEATFTLLSGELKSPIFLEKDFEKKTMPIFCFPGQLNQVFMNIMLNAIQALKGVGTIKVKVKEQKDSILISISDNGPGIPDDKKEKIFEPFYTTKNIQEGTGLGLSISFGIIKKHNGEIVVIDNNPKGTQFIIQLPKKGSDIQLTN